MNTFSFFWTFLFKYWIIWTFIEMKPCEKFRGKNHYLVELLTTHWHLKCSAVVKTTLTETKTLPRPERTETETRPRLLEVEVETKPRPYISKENHNKTSKCEFMQPLSSYYQWFEVISCFWEGPFSLLSVRHGQKAWVRPVRDWDKTKKTDLEYYNTTEMWVWLHIAFC